MIVAIAMQHKQLVDCARRRAARSKIEDACRNGNHSLDQMIQLLAAQTGHNLRQKFSELLLKNLFQIIVIRPN